MKLPTKNSTSAKIIFQNKDKVFLDKQKFRCLSPTSDVPVRSVREVLQAKRKGY